MKLLLDTHALIWWDGSSSQLSPAADAALRDPANEVLFSVLSVWEMVIKVQLGKLTLRVPPATLAADQMDNGLRLLDLTLDHVLGVQSLPPAHRDPFDRILVAQALTEGAVLVTSDHIFAQYPAPTLW